LSTSAAKWTGKEGLLRSLSYDIRRSLKRLLQRLPKGVEATEESRSSFIDSSGELVSNTRHAYNLALEPGVKARPRALLQAQFYPQSETVKFCVCDCGIGIKRSMEGVGGKHPSHLDAIDSALALRNKGDNSDGKGLGLATLQSFVRKNGGILSNPVRRCAESPAWNKVLSNTAVTKMGWHNCQP
jgi:K+-sensing histidine kinase KdpD